MLLKIESPSNNNEYNNTPIYISYYIKSLHRPFCTSLLSYFVTIDYTRYIYVPLCIMIC